MSQSAAKNCFKAENKSELIPDSNTRMIKSILCRFRSVPPSSLLSLALIYRSCKDMENDDNISNRLFIDVCRNLRDLNYLDQSTVLLCDLVIKQPQFTEALTNFMQQMHCQLLNPSNSILPAPLNDLDKKLSSASSVYTYQSSRYSESFDELEVIAEGGFGTVCKARHKVDKAVYAVKKVFFKYKNDAQFEKIIREAKQLAALKHPNIVNYNNAWLDTDDIGEGAESDSDSSTNSSTNNILNVEDTSCNAEVQTSENYILNQSLKICNLDSDKTQQSSDPIEIPHRRRRHSSGATCSFSDFSSELLSSSIKNLEEMENHISMSYNIKKMTIRATLYIQMEYCDHDLRSWLKSRNSNSSNSLMKHLKPMDIFYQVLNGVEYLHSKSVIHRDLTPNNIFITNGIVKIGDFGLACLVDQTQESICSNGGLSSVLGTPPYGAPEQKGNHQYDFKVDIYSLGIVLLELLCPCKTSMEFSLLVENVLKEDYPEQLLQKLPDHVCLIKQMTEIDSSKRPPANKILQNPLFRPRSAKMRTEDLKVRMLKIVKSHKELEDTVQYLKKEQDGVLQKCIEENKRLKSENMKLKKDSEKQIVEIQRLKQIIAHLENQNL